MDEFRRGRVQVWTSSGVDEFRRGRNFKNTNLVWTSLGVDEFSVDEFGVDELGCGRVKRGRVTLHPERVAECVF